jgi:phage/plasmid-associated DNA primase
MMSGVFCKTFDTFRCKLSEKQVNSKTQKERDDIETSIRQIGEMKKRLKKHGYKNTLIKECCDRFHHEKFDDIHDINPCLFPFRNCVIEVDDDLGKPFIRDGKPEDYITVIAGIAFPKAFNKDTPAVLKFEKWMSQLFPNEELRHEFLKWISSCLRSKNMDKKLPMFTGPPNGGKTTLFNCISMAFGPLHQVFENDMFQKASSAGAANPSLADARYAKLITMEEFNSDDMDIPAELIKKWTGNNKMRARKLHENGSMFDFVAKIAFAFNRFPKIKGADQAVRERAMPIPMLSRWTKDAPDDEEEQEKTRNFKIDRFFENNLPEMAKALVWYMVHYYPQYAEEGLCEIESIKDAAAEYWREVDVYQKFIDEVLIEVKDDDGNKDEKVTLSVAVAYDKFGDWHEANYKGLRPVIRPTFEREMNDKVGKHSKGQWRGVSLKDGEGSGRKLKKKGG